MLQLSSLTKGFGDRILFENVTWQLSAGDRASVWCGPNGAGKTTLLRMLAGSTNPTPGAITKRTGLTVGYLPRTGSPIAGGR